MLNRSLDMNGAVLKLIHNQDRPGMEWIIKISPVTLFTSFECGLESEESVTNRIIMYIYIPFTSLIISGN